jgi:hypothetical protein
VAIFFIAACTTKKEVSPAYSNRQITPDSIFTAKFFPKGDGFTGSDGTYSVQLPDGRTLWIFGDTFIGNVTPDNRRIKTNPSYIRNSFVLFEGNELRTLHQGEPHEFKSMMIPPEVSDGTSGFTELQLWYWPGDAFIENGKLNVFASKFFQKDHTDMWAFEFRGTELVEFSLPDVKLSGVHRFNDLDSIHYGHAVYEAPDYTYIYGLKNELAYVARAMKGNVRGSWQFYNGKEWVDDVRDAAPMLDAKGSEQFSVIDHKGTYILIMQDTDLGRKIYSYTSSTPYGPWENRKMIYETPIPENCQQCWTYNALAHPQFTENDLLLVSYNTNSMRMEDHYDNALIYRPRFIRVPFERIIGR